MASTSSDQTDATRGAGPPEEILLAALTAAKSRADSLVTEIESDAKAAAEQKRDIEQGRAFGATAKSELEANLSNAREYLVQLKQQVDAATASITEVNGLCASAQTASKQTTDISTQAVAALESIRATATNATDAATRAEASRTQVEQTAAVVATKSDHIENARVHADEVRAKIDAVATQSQQSATSAEAQHQASRSTVESINWRRSWGSAAFRPRWARSWRAASGGVRRVGRRERGEVLTRGCSTRSGRSTHQTTS